MTTITINLAEILESRLRHGFSVPVTIDVGDLIDYADDDWDETIDLDAYLAGRHEAAIIFSAKDVQMLRPHLTDTQAWEVAEVTRDQTRDVVHDFMSDVADMNYPTTKQELLRRVWNGKVSLTKPFVEREEASGFLQQLQIIERLIEKFPEDAMANPAIVGSIAAMLDDIERVVAGWSNTEKQEG